MDAIARCCNHGEEQDFKVSSSSTSSELLVKAGSELDAFDEDVCTPLWHAFFLNHDDVADYLLDQGARLEKIWISDHFPSIPPPWAEDMFLCRQACRSTALAFMGLLRRSRVIGGNGRDSLQLIARLIWLGRRSEKWSLLEKPSKHARGSL